MLSLTDVFAGAVVAVLSTCFGWTAELQSIVDPTAQFH